MVSRGERERARRASNGLRAAHRLHRHRRRPPRASEHLSADGAADGDVAGAVDEARADHAHVRGLRGAARGSRLMGTGRARRSRVGVTRVGKSDGNATRRTMRWPGTR